MNGLEQRNFNSLFGAMPSDCYSVTEHLTTDSTLEREFPLKTYTVATIPTIPSSLWSVAPWAITSTRLETLSAPQELNPAKAAAQRW